MGSTEVTSQRCPSPNPQYLWTCYIKWQRGIKAADGIKVTDFKLGRLSCIMLVAQYNHKGP